MVKILLVRAIVVAGALVFSVVAQADEYPYQGIVYNTKETNSLTYFCTKLENSSLECKFTQTRVRKKFNPIELKSALDKAKKQFPKEIKEINKTCSDQNSWADIFYGKKKPQNREQEEAIKNMTSLARKDMSIFLESFENFCKKKDEESYMNFVRVSLDREARTCIVSSYNFEQKFSLVEDSNTGSRAWVTNGAPSGPCGIVQASRFVPDLSQSSKIVFWNYISRKIITNKAGRIFPNMSCKDLDENEFLFEWKSKEHALGCDYINFSSF